MKTTTSKFILVSLIVTSIIFLTSSFNKQMPGNKYLTFRVLEVGANSTMAIVYEDGRTEEFELKSWGAKNFAPNTLKINQTVNDLANKGYELISTSGGEYVTTYTFLKK